MRVRRELAIALGVALTVAGSLRAVPAVAQDPSPAPTGPLCLLTVAEMTDLLGVPIATLAAADGECAYSANLTQRQVQVVLSAIVPVNVASDPTADPLLTIRYGHTAHGKDTKIAGRPAWVADDGAWVDVGAEVLGVWLNTAFDDDPPPPKVAISIAKTVVPMYLAAPRPSPTPRAGLPGRFPSSLAGSRLDPFPYPPADYLSMVESMGPPGGDHVGELRDAIVALGTTVDALQVLDASAYDSASGGSLDIIAIQAPGLDVTPLLAPAIAALTDFKPGPPEQVTIAGHDLVHLVDAAGGATVAERWFTVDGDVLWVLNGPRPLVEELMTSLPAASAP